MPGPTTFISSGHVPLPLWGNDGEQFFLTWMVGQDFWCGRVRTMHIINSFVHISNLEPASPSHSLYSRHVSLHVPIASAYEMSGCPMCQSHFYW